jgi:hypothetical protein
MDSTVIRLDDIGLFLSGHIKTNVCKTTVEDVDHLKSRIMQDIGAIRQEKLHDVFLEIRKRLNFCIEVKGNTFEEHL